MKIRGPPHELIVLMCMRYETLTMWKDQAANWFWMDKDLLTDEHLHHLSQRNLMRQRVKGLQVEDLLVDTLERGSGSPQAALRSAMRSPRSCSVSSQPAADSTCVTSPNTELTTDSRQQIPNQDVALRTNLSLQRPRCQITRSEFMKCLHSFPSAAVAIDCGIVSTIKTGARKGVSGSSSFVN